MADPDHMERFQEYLRERLRASGVSMRRLSLAMNKDAAYIAQLLESKPQRPRSLPTPDELRPAAELLGVSFLELLEAAWGIKRAELAAEMEAVAAHRGACAEELEDLSEAELETVMTFIGYVKAQRAQRQHEAVGA